MANTLDRGYRWDQRGWEEWRYVSPAGKIVGSVKRSLFSADEYAAYLHGDPGRSLGDFVGMGNAQHAVEAAHAGRFQQEDKR